MRTEDEKKLEAWAIVVNLRSFCYHFFTRREYKRYPAFPENILDILNETDFKQWILNKVMEFKKTNIYKNKSACVFEP